MKVEINNKLEEVEEFETWAEMCDAYKHDKAEEITEHIIKLSKKNKFIAYAYVKYPNFF